MKSRLILVLVFSLTFLLDTLIRAEDDRQVWARQVAAGAVINVKDARYKALGDGNHDDTSALQNAINDASVPGQPTAKILLIPPGTYLVSSTLRVTNTRYFRMVGGGATTLLWRGNSTGPALEIVNASFSEFSNFGIVVKNGYHLQTGLLVANNPNLPGQSTGNTFRNFGVGSQLDQLRIGIQIGRIEGGELKNDLHQFLHCGIANFTDKGIAVRSPVAKDLFFYNPRVVGTNANSGLDLQGGSVYYLNGGISGVQTEFVVTAPTGPIEINLTDAEACGKFLLAQAADNGRLDIGLDNNRIAYSSDPNFVTIDGPGNVRLTRNQFNNYGATTTPAYLGSPNGFTILRTGALASDVFEFQYNRVYGFSPAQALTIASLFPSQQPTLSCENHYWGWPVSDPTIKLVAGRYDSTAGAPLPADTTALDAQLNRLRNLSNSQSLFIGRVNNKKTVITSTGVAGVINVRQYNAKGDGITDDTAAFKSAIQDLNCGWFNAGLILVPAGNYVIKEPLLIGPSAQGLQIVGEGSNRSRILWAGTGGTVVDFAGVFRGEIRGIGINLAPGSIAEYGLRLRSFEMVSAYNSIADVSINGSDGSLTTALKVGDGTDVATDDANNDFHVFQNVVVSGYRDTGIAVANSQIINLVFLDCHMQGAPIGAGFVSQKGVTIDKGTLSWFGGGGQNHSLYTLGIGTYGNAPVIFHDATFTGSPQLVNTGGPFCNMALLDLDHVRFTSDGSSNNALDFMYPGVIITENCTFLLNNAQKVNHFGDYSPYIDKSATPEQQAAYKSLNGFAFLSNTIVSTTATPANFFSGSLPTVSSGNQFLPSLP